MNAPVGERLVIAVGGVAKDALLQRLHQAGTRLNALAEELFADPRFTTSAQPVATPVALVSVASLGLASGASFDSIVEQAGRDGLSLCPLELGPHLRLALTAQPEGSIGQPPSEGRAPPGAITVASAPLDDRDETPKGFYLRRIDGTPWLRGYRSWSGHRWSPDDVFAFIEPGVA